MEIMPFDVQRDKTHGGSKACRYAKASGNSCLFGFDSTEVYFKENAMVTKRTLAVESVTIQSKFIPGSCDGFALRDTTPKQQREITAIAYDLWLARAFRNGSLQEDWLKAQRQVQKRNQRCIRTSPTNISAYSGPGHSS